MSLANKRNKNNQRHRRMKLTPFYGKTIHCTGVIDEFGYAKSYGVSLLNRPQICIKHIEHENEYVTNHVWAEVSHELTQRLSVGDKIKFDGYVYAYNKSTNQDVWKYSLRISNVEKYKR